MPGIPGKQVVGDFINFVFGSFRSQIKAGTLTANRSVTLPDKDGTPRVSEFPAAFTSVVPLQGDTSFPTQTVTGAISFSLSGATKSACARTIYRLIANGVNIPTFTGFTESSESIGYYNSNGILNIITFEWDGVTAWYRISQAKFAMPTTSTVAISFPSRSASAVINGSNPAIYQSTDAEGTNFQSLMVSAQTIPAGKYGRITVGAHPLVLLGLNNSGALETYANFEYSVWGSGTNVFTIGTAGGSVVNSGITISSTAERFYRLTRFSNGTVTAETSPDGTTWTLITTFGTTNTATLYVAAAISGNQANRFMRIVSFELEL